MAKRSAKSRASVAIRSDHDTERMGDRLRELRVRRGLSIARLAKLSGVPGSTISKIENRRLGPSLVTAINLAHALEENLGFLVGRYRNPPEPVVVVRAPLRETIEYAEMGLALQDLNGHFFPGILEARVGILSRGATSGRTMMTHSGEEFCYVIAGAIRYQIDTETVLLQSGDYVQFKSSIRHSWENIVRGETRVLWVFSDGLSF